MLWLKMSPRNVAADWRLLWKFCRKRGGRGGGPENLFRNMTIIVLRSEKPNTLSKVHAELVETEHC